MNNQRRKRIDELLEKIDAMRNELEDLRSEIEDVQAEEQEAYDNLPESIQDSEKGQTMQEAIDNLDTALSEIDYIDYDALYDALDNAKGY